MKKTIFIFLFNFVCLFFYSQSYRLVKRFDKENSEIADNSIYDLEEDKYGFLWIATENGISRFDGKNFYNYTVKDGLPSNEIISLAKEPDGRIWVNCFRRPPAYFDEKLNNFVCRRVAEIEEKSTNVLQSYQPLQGGIVFFNREQQIYYRNGQLERVQKLFLPSIKGDYSFYEVITRTKANSYVKKREKFYPLDSHLNYFLVNKKIFGVDYKHYNYISEFSQFSLHQPFYKEEKIQFPDGIKWKKFYNNRLLVATKKNMLKIIDLNQFCIIKELSVPEEINNAFIDSKQNLWIGVKNSGIRLYKASEIYTYPIDMPHFNKNFNSICASNDGTLFAGNATGQLLKLDKLKADQILDLNDKNIKVRKILMFGSSPLIVSDNGYAYQGKSTIPIIDHKGIFGALKTAEKLNDSIAVIGGIRGLVLLNVENRKVKKINFPEIRITNITKANPNELLISSAKGLYVYNIALDTYKIISKKYIFSEAIALGDLYFVSTILGEIEVFRNGQWLQTISNAEQLPSAITKIKMINNALWIGGKDGLYKLTFWNKVGKLAYKISKITQNDGLISNEVYDFDHKGNSVYVATDKGISVVSLNIKTPSFDITPQIISLQINGQKASVQEQYQLEKNQGNISLLLSAVELSGHAKALQYRLNNEEKWIPLNSNIINLQLKSGITKLSIRALDCNNNISTKIKTLLFDVAIPIYERFWFWFLMSGFFFGSIILLYSYWKFLRQKEFYQHRLALETQRRKITADLHDDLGATLSSLQINSAVARKTLEKDIEQSKKILRKIEHQAKHISENIGDIIWSLKPGRDQFMSLGIRIKNFANEVLGSQDIPFKINIEKNLDEEIKDFTLRKNLLLIAKEALNNAAKYSHATNVELSLTKEENYYNFTITDNGIGFDPGAKEGNGIQNMEKRAKELNAIFEIFSKNGTKIHIAIPIIRE